VAPTTKLLIAVTNITGSANDGTTSASLTTGNLYLVVYWNLLTKPERFS
jgi:hypothetical protein